MRASTTNRSASLNLDFADVYKPILVDRLIFSLVNCHQIHRDDFVNRDGGVYLSDHGKRTVIEAWEEKLETKLKRGDKETSYRNLIRSEINGFEKALLYGKKFSPYKYY